MNRKSPLARTSRLSIESRRYEFPDETQQIASQVLKGKPLSCFRIESLLEVGEYLQEFKKDVIKKTQDYMYAQRIEDKWNEINLYCTKTTYEQQQVNDYDSLCQRMRSASDEYDKAKQDKQNFISEFNQQKKEAIDSLLLEQETALQEFDKMNSRGLPPKFNKYSSDYLNQRKKEQSLVSAKLYIAAYWMKKDTDKMMLKENELMKTNWSNYVEVKRDILLKQQQQQIDCLVDKYETFYISKIKELDLNIKKCRRAYESARMKVSSAEMYNSPGSRKTRSGLFIPIPENNISARISRMRASNYQSKRDSNIRVTSRPRTSLY